MERNIIFLIPVLFVFLLYGCDQGPATPNITTYTLKYVSNGGIPAESNPNEYFAGETVSAEPPGTYSNGSNTLLSWNTEPDGSGVGYSAILDFEMPDNDLILYAVWIDSDYVTFDKLDGITDDSYIQIDPDGGVDPAYRFVHNINTFYPSKYKVSYKLWFSVLQWAKSNGYDFETASGSGMEGTSGEIGTLPENPPTGDPVTSISWNNVIIWCNAYSEISGLDPVYLDSVDNSILRKAENANYSVTYDQSRNGYSLLTEGEWQFMASNRGTTPPDTTISTTISGTNADSSTYEINDLPDMSTSVIKEMCYDFRTVYPGSTNQTDYFMEDTSSTRTIRHSTPGKRESINATSINSQSGFRIKRR